MKPYLANLDYEVVVNSNLMRGDVILQFDGVEVHDVAANRLASHPLVDSNNAVDDIATNADNIIADDNIATAENTVVADNRAADENADLANIVTGDELLLPSDEPDS